MQGPPHTVMAGHDPAIQRDTHDLAEEVLDGLLGNCHDKRKR